MNTSWGYKKSDNDWKSTQSLNRMLVDIASKGGNLLLNVGPTAEGEIPDSSVVRLEQIGSWMKQNSESIYAYHTILFSERVGSIANRKKSETATRTEYPTALFRA